MLNLRVEVAKGPRIVLKDGRYEDITTGSALTSDELQLNQRTRDTTTTFPRVHIPLAPLRTTHGK